MFGAKSEESMVLQIIGWLVCCGCGKPQFSSLLRDNYVGGVCIQNLKTLDYFFKKKDESIFSYIFHLL